MKKSSKIIIAIIGLLLVFSAIYYKKMHTKVAVENIIGCYVHSNGTDTYSLNISSQKGESVEGTLVYKNPDKKSSTGTIKGTYKNGILIADYSFESENVNDLMQVAFKKQDANFIGGYEKNSVGNRFTSLNDIIYDSSGLFKASTETCATEL